MKPNPMLSEIRRVRDQIARRNDHDLPRIVADLKAGAKQAKRRIAEMKATKPAKPKPAPRRRKAA